jgi:DNA-directed RNA polymerase sigma subunit (sigma70/sigma32)
MDLKIDEALKNRIVIILAVLSVVFFFGTLSSCSSAMRQKAAHDKEMAARLALEEKMSKFSQDKSALEEKAKAKEKEAQELKDALEATKKALLQDQLVNQSLKEELEKVTKPKDALGENSKETATGDKKPKK